MPLRRAPLAGLPLPLLLSACDASAPAATDAERATSTVAREYVDEVLGVMRARAPDSSETVGRALAWLRQRS